jgi:hypothetical protein
MAQEQGILPSIKMPPQKFCEIVLKKINNKKSFFPPFYPASTHWVSQGGIKKRKEKYMGVFWKMKYK